MPKTSQRGFTLIELLVVMGLMTILIGIAVLALVRPQAKNSVTTTATTLAADIKQQQLLAMSGDSGSQANAQNHGVRLTANSYTTFTGATFATSTDQYTVNLSQGISISGVTLPFDIIFTVRSGETTAVNGILIQDTGGDHQTININRLGAVNVN